MKIYCFAHLEFGPSLPSPKWPVSPPLRHQKFWALYLCFLISLHFSKLSSIWLCIELVLVFVSLFCTIWTPSFEFAFTSLPIPLTTSLIPTHHIHISFVSEDFQFIHCRWTIPIIVTSPIFSVCLKSKPTQLPTSLLRNFVWISTQKRHLQDLSGGERIRGWKPASNLHWTKPNFS